MERNFKCLPLSFEFPLNKETPFRQCSHEILKTYKIYYILQAWMLFYVLIVFQLLPLTCSFSHCLVGTGKMYPHLLKAMLHSPKKKDRTSLVHCSGSGIPECFPGKLSTCSSSTSGRKKGSNCS